MPAKRNRDTAGQDSTSGNSRPARGAGRAAPLSRRVPFAHQVADLLRDRIIRGDMPPGERIVERALCELLAVSRTPLREALKLLEVEGLVELSQNRGARIMSFTPEEARNLFEVIAGLEGLAAELATARMSPPERDALDALHARMLAHYRAEDKDPYFDLNSTIHDTVVRLSGNPVLVATHATLMLRARRGRYMAILNPERWAESVSEHEALMAAFHDRDAEAASRVWRRHLTRTGETVGAVLASRVPPHADDGIG